MDLDLFEKYRLTIDLRILKGSFNSVNDVQDYIRYRLNLRSRNSDSILVDDMVVVPVVPDVKSDFKQMEMLV